MKRVYDAVDHPELNLLVAMLRPDPERDRVAAASAEANARAAALGAELDTLTARAAEVANQIGAGVVNHADRAALAKARAAVETEGLFAPGRLHAATLERARCELDYLAYVHRTVVVAERDAEAAHLAAHRAWQGPSADANLLAQTNYPQHNGRRAALAAQLVPLTRARGEAGRRVADLQGLRHILRAFTETRYGPGVDLAKPPTFKAPVQAFVGRVVERWRAARAA